MSRGISGAELQQRKKEDICDTRDLFIFSSMTHTVSERERERGERNLISIQRLSDHPSD
jgi:hypothetical protein